MRFNVLSYFIIEGFRNVLKNKKSTFSCLGVMCATMLMFGLFYAIGQNITHMLKNIEEEQGMSVFIVSEATEEEYQTIGEEIKKIHGVNTITPVSQEDAYNQMKNKFPEDKRDSMEGIDPSIFPRAYTVTLTDLKLNGSVQDEINKMNYIKKITSRDDTISALANIGNWIRIITLVLLVILILISVFIIANTIKLTVHARRKEISIMKYVGATNSFIRAPFMVEGIIIGLISGLLATFLVSGGYTFLKAKIESSGAVLKLGVSAILNFSEMINQIIIVFLILGVGIGIIGSIMSMRRYLDV